MNKYLKISLICSVLSLVSGFSIRASENITTKVENNPELRVRIKKNLKKDNSKRFYRSKLGQWIIKRIEQKLERKRKRLKRRETRGKTLQDKQQYFLYEMFGLITIGVVISLIGLFFLLFARSWGIALIIIGGIVTGITMIFLLILLILLSKAS